MSWWVELIIAVVMAVGIVGIVIPGIPGLSMVWLSGLVWAGFDGGGSTRWSLFALMTLSFAIGVYASIALPAQQAQSAKQPRTTLIVAALFGIVGFFVIPIVGLPIGFALGIYVMSMNELQDTGLAWRRTVDTLRAFGLALITQLACGIFISLLWLTGLILT